MELWVIFYIHKMIIRLQFHMQWRSLSSIYKINEEDDDDVEVEGRTNPDNAQQKRQKEQMQKAQEETSSTINTWIMRQSTQLVANMDIKSWYLHSSVCAKIIWNHYILTLTILVYVYPRMENFLFQSFQQLVKQRRQFVDKWRRRMTL